MPRRFVGIDGLWLCLWIVGLLGAGLKPASAQYPGYGAYDTDPYRTRLHDYGTGYSGGLGFETPNYSVYPDEPGREYMTPHGYEPPPPLLPPLKIPSLPTVTSAAPPPPPRARAQIYADPLGTRQKQARLEAAGPPPSDEALGESVNRRTGQVVANPDAGQRPGTIIVDTNRRHLYLVLEDGRAMEYAIGVGPDGLAWKGAASVQRKAEWPEWTPSPNALKDSPGLPRHIAGGLDNPLGARALYVYQGRHDTMFRIHGTNDPDSVGKDVPLGCIRMMNGDIIDLYQRVRLGSKVVVL